MKVRFQALLLVGSVVLTGCPRDKTDDGLTLAEASQAVDESTIGSQGEGVTSETIEISTSFTIGHAVQTAAQELSTFIASQRPCASVTPSGSTVTVVYGANGSCLYNGHVITGTSEVTITKNDAAGVTVDHHFTALSNGLVQVDGTAEVTWTEANQSRHVVHDLVIERLRDQKTVDSSGDRTQTPLSGDLTTGIVVNGTRTWTSSAGTWDLTIDNVQMRWGDPIPQAGMYTLLTPKSKALTLGFKRADADTITVTLSGPKRSFSFDVSSTGESTAR